MGHGIDRVPAGLDHELVDRERAALDEAPDREPAAAVVRREERSEEPLLRLDAAADRGGVHLLPGRRRLGDRVTHEPRLERETIDARHRADAAEHGAERHRGEDRIGASPHAAARLGAPRTGRCARRHDEAHPREAGEPAEESRHAVLRPAARAGPMVHRHLLDAVAGPPDEHGDEAVHVALEQERLRDVAPEGLQAAVVIMEREPAHRAEQEVEDRRGHGLVPRVEPGVLPAVDEAHPAVAPQPLEEPGNLGGIVLAVAVEHDDERGPAGREAAGEGGRLAQRRPVADALHARVGRSRGGDLVPGVVGRAVVDEKRLPGQPGGVEDGADLGDERPDVACLVTGGHHEGDVGNGHRVGFPGRDGSGEASSAVRGKDTERRRAVAIRPRAPSVTRAECAPPACIVA
jgi:hypothetical protein